MDTIGDFLTRIRNAGLAGHDKVDIPASNMRQGIARILKDSGVIRDFKVAKDSKQGVMRVYLKYDEGGKPVMTAIRRVSRPGKRIYIQAQSIPEIRSGLGLAILSTSQGVLSGAEAKEKNLGGEFLCKIW